MKIIQTKAIPIHSIFKKINTNKLNLKTNDLPKKSAKGFTLPALTAGIKNQGLMNYVPKNKATILKRVISISANGANTGATFFQPKEFTVLQDAYAIDFINIQNASKEVYLYFTVLLSKSIKGNFSWTNKAGWNRIKNRKIEVPVKKDGTYDFEYMTNYVKRIETDYVKHIETDYEKRIETYLKVLGYQNIKSIELTEKDKETLKKMKESPIASFKLRDLFEWRRNIEFSPLKLNEYTKYNEEAHPFVGQSTTNHGVIGFYSLKKELLNNSVSAPTILIHSNNQSIQFIDTPFYLKDGHGATSILQSKYLSRKTAPYFQTLISNNIKSRFSYNGKATKINLKNTMINLPVNSEGSVAIELIKSYMNVIEKLTVQNLVSESKTYNDAFNSFI